MSVPRPDFDVAQLALSARADARDDLSVVEFRRYVGIALALPDLAYGISTGFSRMRRDIDFDQYRGPGERSVSRWSSLSQDAISVTRAQYGSPFVIDFAVVDQVAILVVGGALSLGLLANRVTKSIVDVGRFRRDSAESRYLDEEAASLSAQRERLSENLRRSDPDFYPIDPYTSALMNVSDAQARLIEQMRQAAADERERLTRREKRQSVRNEIRSMLEAGLLPPEQTDAWSKLLEDESPGIVVALDTIIDANAVGLELVVSDDGPSGRGALSA